MFRKCWICSEQPRCSEILAPIYSGRNKGHRLVGDPVLLLAFLEATFEVGLILSGGKIEMAPETHPFLPGCENPTGSDWMHLETFISLSLSGGIFSIFNMAFRSGPALNGQLPRLTNVVNRLYMSTMSPF